MGDVNIIYISLFLIKNSNSRQNFIQYKEFYVTCIFLSVIPLYQTSLP